MRVQTSFEKIAAATNGQLFGWSFIGLRIYLGVVSAFIALRSGAITWWNPDFSLSAAELAWSSMTQIILLGLGLSLITGLLVRPLSGAMSVYLLASAFMVINGVSQNPGILYMYIPILFLLGMYMSGGAGHAFGLDGVVLRNLRRQNSFTKFLFG